MTTSGRLIDQVAILGLSLGFLALLLYDPLLAGLAAAGVLGVMLFTTKPFWGLCTIVLLQSVTLMSDAEISLGEIAVATLLGLMLLIWLFHTYLVREEKLLESVTDWLLFTFLMITLFSCITTWASGGKLTSWFRELLYIVFYLVYFWSRKFIRTKKQVKIMWICMAIVASAHMVKQIYFYLVKLNDITALWQVLTSRIAGLELVFFIGILYAIIFYCYSQTISKKLFFATFLASMAMSLIITFTRSFWLLSFIAVFVIFVFLPLREKFSLITLLVIGSVLTIVIGFIFFEDMMILVINTVIDRFASSAKGTRDRSLYARFAEVYVLTPQVAVNPIVGYGPGTFYQYYSPANRNFLDRTFIHTEYVSFLFKYGLIGLLSYGLFYLRSFWNSFVLWVKTRDQFLKLIFMGYFIFLMIFSVAALTDRRFLSKGGAMFIGIGAAVVENMRRGDLKVDEDEA